MSIDLSEDPSGRAVAFATACAGTWVFIRNFVMRPAIKSCHQRCTDLEHFMERLESELAAKSARISQLETALFTSGIPELRKAMQAAVSENHVEMVAIRQKVDGV
jgi:acetate kinase